MVRRAVFTTAYSSCECVIIFIFLRGRFPRFGLFIIFFVVMVLSFFFCHEEVAADSKLLMLLSSRRVWMYKLEGKCISIQEFMSCLS